MSSISRNTNSAPSSTSSRTTVDLNSALSDAEKLHAIGHLEEALNLLSPFIRIKFDHRAVDLAVMGSNASDQMMEWGNPHAAFSGTSLAEDLKDALILRGKIHLQFAQHSLTRDTSLSESKPLYGNDPIVECELAVKDADTILKECPTFHAAHILRAEAAVTGMPLRAREFLLDSLHYYPEDEQLRDMMNKLPKGPQSGQSRFSATAPATETAAATAEGNGVELQDVPSELECPLCMKLFLEPVTSPCGHTFCRHCLLVSLDYGTESRKQQCPLCRSALCMSAVDHPITVTIANIIDSFFKKESTERKREHEMANRAESSGNTELNPSVGPSVVQRGIKSKVFTLPLFVLMNVFPGHAQPLQIFEPRYRLMFRRLLQGSQQFGMVGHLPNKSDFVSRLRKRLGFRSSGEETAPSGENQEEEHPEGWSPMSQVGTLMKVTESSVLPDGRLIIHSIAASRFLILEHWEHDGYRMGSVIPLKDDTLTIVPDEEDVAAIAANRCDGDHLDGQALLQGGGEGSKDQQQPTDNDTVTQTQARELCAVVEKLLGFIQTRTKSKIPAAFNVRPLPPSSLEPASLWLSPFFSANDEDTLGSLSATSTVHRLGKLKQVAEKFKII